MNRKKVIMLLVITLLLATGTIINLHKNSVGKPKAATTTTISAKTIESTTTTTKVATTSKKTAKKTTRRIIKKVSTASYNEYQQYAQQIGGYDETQMDSLIKLWNRESGWNPNARNKKSGACGIPQALPCSKIVKQQGSNDWKAQIRWGINYIKNRYGTPSQAWKHFQRKGWY